jgi:hypothetical protein
VVDGLGGAESYIVYRVRMAIERGADRQEAYVHARALLERAEDSPERQEALRLLADRLELPREMLGGISAARTGGSARATPSEPPRVLEAGLRLERETLAAVLANPSLRQALEALSDDHFTHETHRRFRDVLVGGAPAGDELVALHAELTARAERDVLDERAGRELLLRLRERHLRRELQNADLARTTELQAQLAAVRQALAELS